mmetsp:Transcript_12040/g.32924  ORF Transcript_12040/g.32924 Transcript_12040/m.32924 type:complete len:209 (+) Transcript_12040:416-1042(+)
MQGVAVLFRRGLRRGRLTWSATRAGMMMMVVVVVGTGATRLQGVGLILIRVALACQDCRATQRPYTFSQRRFLPRKHPCCSCLLECLEAQSQLQFGALVALDLFYIGCQVFTLPAPQLSLNSSCLYRALAESCSQFLKQGFVLPFLLVLQETPEPQVQARIVPCTLMVQPHELLHETQRGVSQWCRLRSTIPILRLRQYASVCLCCRC